MEEHDDFKRELFKPSEETKQIVGAGRKKAEKLGLRQVNQEVILLGFLSKKTFQEILQEHFNVKARKLEEELKSVIRNSDNAKKNIQDADSGAGMVTLGAQLETQAAGLELVGPFQLFESLISNGKGHVHDILEKASITKDKLPQIRKLAKSMNQSFKQ